MALDAACAVAHYDLAVLYATNDPPRLDTALEHYRKAVALGTKPEAAMDKLFGLPAAGSR